MHFTTLYRGSKERYMLKSTSRKVTIALATGALTLFGAGAALAEEGGGGGDGGGGGSEMPPSPLCSVPGAAAIACGAA